MLLGAILAKDSSALKRITAPSQARCLAAYTELHELAKPDRRRAIRQLSQSVLTPNERTTE